MNKIFKVEISVKEAMRRGAHGQCSKEKVFASHRFYVDANKDYGSAAFYNDLKKHTLVEMIDRYCLKDEELVERYTDISNEDSINKHEDDYINKKVTTNNVAKKDNIFKIAEELFNEISTLDAKSQLQIVEDLVKHIVGSGDGWLDDIIKKA